LSWARGSPSGKARPDALQASRDERMPLRQEPRGAARDMAMAPSSPRRPAQASPAGKVAAQASPTRKVVVQVGAASPRGSPRVQRKAEPKEVGAAATMGSPRVQRKAEPKEGLTRKAIVSAKAMGTAPQPQALTRNALMAARAMQNSPSSPQGQVRSLGVSQARSRGCAWAVGAGLLAVVLLAAAAAAFFATARSEGRDPHAASQPPSKQEELLKEAYNAVEDYYRSKALQGHHGGERELQQRLEALERVRQHALEEKVSLNASTPWGEPIMDVLDGIVKDSREAAASHRQPSPSAVRTLLRGGAAGAAAEAEGEEEAEAEEEARGDAGNKDTDRVVVKAPTQERGDAGNKDAHRVVVKAPAQDRETLFCFSLMMSEGLEPDLIAMQVSRSVSIFACDSYAVYSRERKRLGPGPPPFEVETTPIYISVHAETDAKSHLLNAEVFMRVWEAVFQTQQYWNYDWTVKVDPDCVLFPPVLRDHLQMTWGNVAKSEEYKDRGLYLRNCAPKSGSHFGLFGAMEVLSRRAVEVYAQGKLACAAQVQKLSEAEDQFLQSCLDLLQIPFQYDFGLVNDEKCIGKPRPCSSNHAAFHPLTTFRDYGECLLEKGLSQENGTRHPPRARMFLN